MLRKNEAKFSFCEINKKLLFAVILQNPFFVYCRRIRNDEPIHDYPHQRSVAVLSLPKVRCRSVLSGGPLPFYPYRRAVTVLSLPEVRCRSVRGAGGRCWRSCCWCSGSSRRHPAAGSPPPPHPPPPPRVWTKHNGFLFRKSPHLPKTIYN